MFLEKLVEYINLNSSNYYTDNFSFQRFGKPEREFINTSVSHQHIFPYLYKLEKFYNLLNNDQSKALLVNLIAFRLLGHRKVKLPLSIPEYWEALENFDNLFEKDKFIDIDFLGWRLFYKDLSKIDIPIKIYNLGILSTFILKQYEYIIDDDNVIKAKKGDIVIDAGGCWGDTALDFANQVGTEGQVYTFEFIPKNLEILKTNLDLNPTLKEQIEVIDRPVWEKTDIPMYFLDNGPGSVVNINKPEIYTGVVNSLSIDDLCTKYNIEKVDFIKMDIEGAEPFAIKGAVKTIKKFTPQLAIAIYHNMDDFSGIVHQINELGLGYKFYIEHYTVFHEETVLYCKI